MVSILKGSEQNKYLNGTIPKTSLTIVKIKILGFETYDHTPDQASSIGGRLLEVQVHKSL